MVRSIRIDKLVGRQYTSNKKIKKKQQVPIEVLRAINDMGLAVLQVIMPVKN